jgi:hypothetical protein
VEVIAAFFLFGIFIGYFIGKRIAADAAFNRWNRSKRLGPNKCVHNVTSVRAFPKGDRYVCEDCGESNPMYGRLDD